MGNSEVGHLTIGSGRILYQDLVRVTRAVEDGSFFANDALRGAFTRARERGGAVHLLGLVSQGGVHSHIDHLRALLELAATRGDARADMDSRVHRRPGRVARTRRSSDLATLPAERIATVAGRYYAMDRDSAGSGPTRRSAAILHGGEEADDAVAAVGASYARGVSDEFVEPIVLTGRPRLDPARDTAIVFNFRPDRVRQLTRAAARARASTSSR